MAVVTTTGYLLLGLHLSVSFLLLLMVVQYHRRRRFQPIQSRIYWQAEVTALMTFFATFYAAAIAEFEYYITCDAYLLLYVLFFNCNIPILMRTAHVFSAYEISKVYVRGGSSSPEGKLFSHGNIFVRKAEILQSWKYQAGFFILVVLFNFAVYGIYTQAVNPTCEGTDELVWMLISGGVVTGPTMYLSWNMATLKDGLYIRRELLLVPLGGFVLIPSYIGLRLLYGNYFNSNIVAAFTPFWVPLVQIGMPLYKTYAWQKYKQPSQIEDSSKELSLTGYKSEEKRSRQGSYAEFSRHEDEPRHFRGPTPLMKLLHDKNGNALFLEFARLELNHENVMFYNEVTEFLEDSKNDPEKLQSQDFVDHCWKIFKKYISPQSRLEVNLGAKHHAYFQMAGFHQEDGELKREKALYAFEVAWHEVVSLMYNGVYPRFVRSDAYIEFTNGTNLIEQV